MRNSNRENGMIFSPALVAEQFRLRWYVPVLSFLIYFSTGALPLMMYKMQSGVGQNSMYVDYLYGCLHNINFPFGILLFLVPLVAATSQMAFIHQGSRAMAIHSQPFSRRKIYLSHILAGWLFILIPLLLMSLCFLFFSGFAGDNTVGMSSVGSWLFKTIGAATYFYGMFLLAGVLTGNSVMQVLLSGVFFCIIPLMILLIDGYCSAFLTGFSALPDLAVSIQRYANPVILILLGSLTVRNSLIYLLLGVLLMALTGFLYQRAKLERVGDNIMYGFFAELITWILSFVGMTAGGFFLYLLLETKFMMFVGILIGGILTFIIVKMIIEKSVRIISKRNLLSLVCFLVMTCLFCAVILWDVTGYGSRVPDVDQVESVAITDPDGRDVSVYYADGVDGLTIACVEDENGEGRSYTSDGISQSLLVSGDEAKEKVIALHRYIVEHQLYDDSENFVDAAEFESQTDPAETDSADATITELSDVYLTFTYQLKNGKTMVRNYNVNLDQTCYDLLNDWFTDEEVVASRSISNVIPKEAISSVAMYISDFPGIGERSFWFTEEEDIQGLIEAFDADQADLRYGESSAFNQSYFNGSIQVKGDDEDMEISAAYLYPNASTKRTISFLADQLRKSGDGEAAALLRDYIS